MADARTLTPRTFSRNMYIPEENQTFIAGQQGGENSYERFKRETVENTYNDVLRRTGSPEKAQDAAQSVARKMFRTEMVVTALAPEAAIAGAGRAVNLARSILGGEKAGAATQSPLLLTGPRRNAMTPDEMLAPAPAAPSGPPRLTSGEFLPRIDIPRVPSSGITARDVVSSPFDDIGRMAGEGGMSDDAIAAAQRMARDRVAREEAFRARQLAEMEGEGGTAVNEALRQRALRAAEDAGLTARQMSTAEGEGMLTADAVQAAKAMAQNRLAAEEARRAAEVARFMDEGGGMAISGTPAPRTSVPAARPEPGTGFTLGEGSTAYRPNFTMPGAGRTQAGSFGVPALRGGSDVVGNLPAFATQSGYDVGSILRMLGGAGMGAGASSVALNAARDMRGEGAASASPANLQFSDDVRSETPGVAMTGGTSDDGRASYNPVYAALQRAASSSPAAARTAATPARAAEPASVELWRQYNKSMMEEGGGRADLFERARRAEMEERKGAEGRARGGAAGGGKDAALHKALEIIHHMLVKG